jgi:lantibiotic transport system ATP-binding protein
MHCIETLNLTYRFSKSETTLNNINIQVPYGSIYGFLGPNGAGKTTTLKLILGLLDKQEGDIRIFNKSLNTSRIEILERLGALIETPSLYSHLSAIDNLRILQRIYQCPNERIDEVLKIVGLSDVGNKKTSQFSLGMKQRLSIAIALLHSPELLILDEPTNGLDPAGMIEIRELLKRINQQHQTTILISSHLLSEIEKLVTHIGIINKGDILFQGTLEQLHLKQAQKSFVSFETSDAPKTIEILVSNKLKPISVNGEIKIPVVEKETIAKITKQLVYNDVEVYGIKTGKSDLESIFIDLTTK